MSTILPRAFLLCLLLLAVWGSTRVLAVEVLDDRNIPVQLPKPAERVASISTFGADMLLALAMKPVAITRFGPFAQPDYLGERLKDVPVIGSRSQVNMELLSEVAPDLTLAIRRYTEKDADRFNAIAPYVALNLVTLEDSLRAVSVSAELLGKSQEGEALNQRFLDQLNDYAAKAPGNLRVALLVTGAESPFIYYDHFLTAGLLDRLGAQNVGGSSAMLEQGLPLGYRMRLEDLLKQNPDVIFLFASNKERAFTHNPIWPYLKAVRDGRVYEVGQHWKEAAGPIARTLVLEEMAHRLYPDVFAMPELPETLRSRPYQ